MKKRKSQIILYVCCLAMVWGLVGCTSKPQEEAMPTVGGTVQPIVADFKNGKGEKIGTVTMRETEKGVKTEVEVNGLSKGEHGLHVHAVGRCEPPDFETAGGHFNPNQRKHGLLNQAGPHAGDLPNLVVSSALTKATFYSTYISLHKNSPNSLDRKEGSSLIIHAASDDLVSDPSGNSGARIACAVLVPAQ
jgi:Cu-Zn family superoxide dismutase